MLRWRLRWRMTVCISGFQGEKFAITVFAKSSWTCEQKCCCCFDTYFWHFLNLRLLANLCFNYYDFCHLETVRVGCISYHLSVGLFSLFEREKTAPNLSLWSSYRWFKQLCFFVASANIERGVAINTEPYKPLKAIHSTVIYCHMALKDGFHWSEEPGPLLR